MIIIDLGRRSWRVALSGPFTGKHLPPTPTTCDPNVVWNWVEGVQVFANVKSQVKRADILFKLLIVPDDALPQRNPAQYTCSTIYRLYNVVKAQMFLNRCLQQGSASRLNLRHSFSRDLQLERLNKPLRCYLEIKHL